MPPIRTNITSTQRQLAFAHTSPNPLNARGTPRRDRTHVPNYALLKRVDEIITNPAPTPRRVQPSSQPNIQGNDDDVDIEDLDEPEEDEDEEVTKEELEIEGSITPTRQGIPSTIIVRTTKKTKKPRKPRKETTWTQHYFNITQLQDTWINKAYKNNSTLTNRLWVCKICGPAFSSTDKERHGNTSRLVKHLKDEHHIDEKKHKLGVDPVQKKGQGGHIKPITGFASTVERIPGAEEAILQFVSVTDQAFEVVEHKTFENLYKSIGTIPSILSADTLKNRMQDRFNTARKQMAKEIKDTCETFSISFDRWSVKIIYIS